MRRSTLTVLSVLIGLILLQGCETVKGISKDISNTSDNVGKLMNSVNESDSAFSNKYW